MGVWVGRVIKLLWQKVFARMVVMDFLCSFHRAFHT